MNEKETKGLGWECGAFSNNETFTRASASTFTSYGSKIGMRVQFVYPGNAKDRMIEDNEDSRFIERTKICAIYSHGSTSGPTLEYNPLNKLTWSYEWGNDGLMRWIFIGGCDALGYPIFPNGNPSANSWPRVSRYNRPFSGITGICGYRSHSWYIPGIQKFTPFTQKYGSKAIKEVGSAYARILVQSMNQRKTFWRSWLDAGTWLHNRLGKAADAAIFCNSTNGLNETLKLHYGNRSQGVDTNSIRRAVIGKGTPEYSYCPTVDNSGNPTCKKFEAKGEVHKIDENLIYLANENSENLTLPEINIVFGEESIKLIENISAELDIPNLKQLVIDTLGDEYSDENSFYTFENDFFSVTGGWVSSGKKKPSFISENTLLSLTSINEVEIDGLSSWQIDKQVKVDDKLYSLSLDSGLNITYNEDNRINVSGDIWEIESISESKRIVPNTEEILKLPFEKTENTIHIIESEVVYVKVETNGQKKLVPSRKVSIVFKNKEMYTTRAMVVYL